jgi:hypothetical protein
MYPSSFQNAYSLLFSVSLIRLSVEKLLGEKGVLKAVNVPLQ